MKIIRITNHQLFSLVACNSMGAAVIITSSIITSIAKQDAWISALLTPVFGTVIILMMCYISGKFPDMSFIGVIKNVFGKWIGTVVSMSYIALCLTIAWHMPWYIGEFMNTHVIPETPTYVINLLFVIAIVIAMLYGLETIARVSELFIRFASMLFFFAMILVLPNAKIDNIKPILENGFSPVLRGSIALACYTTLLSITLLMIYPLNLNNPKEARKHFIKGYLWASFIIFITFLMSILVLGVTVTSKAQYPTYILAKEINVGIVFSRLEFIIAALWIVTEFIICILFFYAGITGLSQLFGLRDYKKLVIPMGLIILVMSGVVFPNTVYHVNWLNHVWMPYIITHGFVLPALLILVYWIKKLKTATK